MLWLHGIQHHWIQESSVCGTCVCVCLSVCGRVRVLPSSEASSWPCRVETSRDASISHLLPTRHTQQLLQAWVLIWVHLHVYKSGIMPHNKKKTQNKTEERNCIKEKWKLQLKWLSQSVWLCYWVSGARATTAVTDSCRTDRWLQVTGETRVHLTDVQSN